MNELFNLFFKLVTVASTLVLVVAIVVAIGLSIFGITRYVAIKFESELAIVVAIILQIIFLIPLGLTLLFAVMRATIL